MFSISIVAFTLQQIMRFDQRIEIVQLLFFELSDVNI